MPKRNRIVWAAGFALGATGVCEADVKNVPADGPLSVVIAQAVSGDEIVISDSGSPYQLFPGITFTNKQLLIRGSTGNRDDVVIDGAGLSVVFTVLGSGSDGTVFQDLTITNGFVASSEPSNSDAAGLRVDGANVTLMNVAMVGNRNESSDGDGAAISAFVCDLTLVDCLIANNTLSSASADSPAVFGSGCNLTLVDTLVSGNRWDMGVTQTTGAAATVLATNGTLQALRCVFERNQGGAGGAIHVSNATVSVIDACRFNGNIASTWGAGLYARDDAGLTTIRNTTFVGNRSLGNDAAIFTSAPLEAENCVFVANQASGTYVIGGSPANRSVVKLDNCILWGNDATDLVPGLPSNAPVLRSCVVQGGYAPPNASTGNIDVDPLLTSMPSSGMDAEWGTDDDDYGDLRPMDMSPCIDAGNSDLYAGPFVDLDGNDRAVDDPATADTGFAIDGPVIDIGAFETAGDLVQACPGDADNSGLVDFGDITNVLNNWLSVCPN